MSSLPDIPPVAAVPAYYWNGFPINAGQLCIDEVGAITHYHNSYPFTVEDRLATSAGPVTYYDQGTQYGAAGRIVL